MVKINNLSFDKSSLDNLRTVKYGTNWPVVYILNDSKEAYVGETTDAKIRGIQHLKIAERKKLEEMWIISDETFNKSTVLDLEAFLIKYMAADGHLLLQNGNGGLQNHNYYQKDYYQSEFKNIWELLRKKGLAKKELRAIENSNLFKYSPYKSLTEDQYMIVNSILEELKEIMESDEKSLFLVNGGAGTGKTILGIFMMKILNDASTYDDDSYLTFDKNLNAALVIPMDNLRKTLKNVFKEIKGLHPNMVLSPNDVAKSKIEYDLLIVDEAHRLRRRVNLAQYQSFDKNNRELGLGNEGTELDWILKKSKHRILFYDEGQSIKPTDVRQKRFDDLMKLPNEHYSHYCSYTLQTQLRCLKGGNEYVDYIKRIFSKFPPEEKVSFQDYEFKLFDDVDTMIKEIKEKDNEYGLSRNIAGYSWKWKTKKIIKLTEEKFDIEIDGHRYIWNTADKDWINSKNSVNEIGSIHTTQGFDLNYTGLIIGNELKYDLEKKKLYVDKTCYFDQNGKRTANEDELLSYVLNIYSIMCTRAMLGTYIYVCDESLRRYLQNYIEYHK